MKKQILFNVFQCGNFSCGEIARLVFQHEGEQRMARAQAEAAEIEKAEQTAEGRQETAELFKEEGIKKIAEASADLAKLIEIAGCSSEKTRAIDPELKLLTAFGLLYEKSKGKEPSRDDIILFKRNRDRVRNKLLIAYGGEQGALRMPADVRKKNYEIKDKKAEAAAWGEVEAYEKYVDGRLKARASKNEAVAAQTEVASDTQANKSAVPATNPAAAAETGGSGSGGLARTVVGFAAGATPDAETAVTPRRAATPAAKAEAAPKRRETRSERLPPEKKVALMKNYINPGGALEGKVTAEGFKQVLDIDLAQETPVVVVVNKVKAIQQELVKNNPNLAVDGIFGPATYAAFIAAHPDKKVDLLKTGTVAAAPAPAEEKKEENAKKIEVLVKLADLKTLKMITYPLSNGVPVQNQYINRYEPGNDVKTARKANEDMDGDILVVSSDKIPGLLKNTPVEVVNRTTKLVTVRGLERVPKPAIVVRVAQGGQFTLFPSDLIPARKADAEKYGNEKFKIASDDFNAKVQADKKALAKPTESKGEDDEFNKVKYYAVLKKPVPITVIGATSGAEIDVETQANQVVAILGQTPTGQYVVRCQGGPDGYVKQDAIDEKTLVAKNSGEDITAFLARVKKPVPATA